MNCDLMEILIHAELDGEIDAEREALLQQHLSGCDSCRNEYARQKELKSLFAEDRASVGAPPADLTDRIMDGLETAAPAGRVHLFPVPRTLARAAAVLLMVGAAFWAGTSFGVKETRAGVDKQREQIERWMDELEDKGVDREELTQLTKKYWSDREKLKGVHRERLDTLYGDLEEAIEALEIRAAKEAR